MTTVYLSVEHSNIQRWLNIGRHQIHVHTSRDPLIARSLYVFGSRISLLYVYYCYCYASQTSVWFFIIFVVAHIRRAVAQSEGKQHTTELQRAREEKKDYGFQYLLVFVFSLHCFSRVVAVIAASHGFYFNPDTFRIYFLFFRFWVCHSVQVERLHRQCRYIRVFKSTYHPFELLLYVIYILSLNQINSAFCLHLIKYSCSRSCSNNKIVIVSFNWKRQGINRQRSPQI